MPDPVFHIDFDDRIRLAVEYDRVRERPGRITIDAFSESFLSATDYWNAADYRRQWREGVRRLLDGADSSCLMTCVGQPAASNFFTWWRLYRLGDNAVFQSALLLLDQLDGPFSFDRLYEYVGPYASVNEDGERISEWVLEMGALSRFAEISA